MSKLKKPVTAVVVTLMAAFGIAIGGASTATAALSDCNSRHACAYDYTGHRGKSVEFENYIPNFGLYGFANDTGSVANNGTSCGVSFYSGNYRNGYRYSLAKGYVDYDLRTNTMPNGKNWNNKIDSGYFCE